MSKTAKVIREKRIPFEKLKPGESLYIEGRKRTAIAQSFCQYMGQGRYSIKKESKGFRFYLLNKGECDAV